MQATTNTELRYDLVSQCLVLIMSLSHIFQVSPASGVPGDCYQLGAEEAVEVVSPEVPELDDGVQHKFRHLGHGMCRGPKWTSQKWPILRGSKSLQDCANSCGRTAGCTAFDLTSRPEAGEQHCTLYGHKTTVPAPGVPGECYTLPGATYLEEQPQKDQFAAERRPSILDEVEEDQTNIGESTVALLEFYEYSVLIRKR